MERLDSLCAVLGDETEVCGALSAVLRREQEAVIALRPDAILACLQERQVLAEELEQLATQRRALVSAVARERGNDAASAGTLLANLPPDRLMRPQAIAEAYWALYQQPRDAWSSEMEIRPFGEKW